MLLRKFRCSIAATSGPGTPLGSQTNDEYAGKTMEDCNAGRAGLAERFLGVAEIHIIHHSSSFEGHLSNRTLRSKPVMSCSVRCKEDRLRDEG